MNTVNPIAQTPEYKALFTTYRENLLKYQPGPRWYFGSIEAGIGYGNTLLTMDDIRRYARRNSPIGPEVPVSEIEDVTPSYKTLVEKFPDGLSFDYDAYSKWIEEQEDTFYYARGSEEFSTNEAYKIAGSLGYKKLILEDLS